MLVDEVTITVEGGRGGRGAVTFGEGKFSHMPSGGEGGNGGSVFVEADVKVLDLGQYRFQKDFKAGNGETGRRNKDGANGSDVVLKVPRGTIVHNRTSGITDELLDTGARIIVAKGGLRGRGNRAFSHARASEPKKFEPGNPGTKAKLFLELQLIADMGLIGLPNVGKSSLLNALTKARSKVANYNFTTLEPHLGVLENGTIVSDIPGLIEGASAGKGLGTKFLRHIRRTRLLLHCIAGTSADPLRDYAVVRNELEAYDPALAQKTEFIVVTKIDEVSPDIVKNHKRLFRGKKVFAVSVLDDESIKSFKRELSRHAF